VEDPAPATDSSGVPFIIERSPLDFANETGPEDQETVAPEVPLPEDVPTTRGVPEVGPAKRVASTDPPAVKECRKRGHNGADANAPPKVLRRDHADPRPTGSTREGKSFASIELGTGSTRPTPMPQSAPADVGDPDPLSFADPRSHLPREPLRQEIRSLKIHLLPLWSGLPRAYTVLSGVYRTAARLTPRRLAKIWWTTLPHQVAMGSQLRLRFEQEAKLLKKSVAQVALRDKRIQA
nr:hypothetical protein [Tanacetum cinerariifolium]